MGDMMAEGETRRVPLLPPLFKGCPDAAYWGMDDKLKNTGLKDTTPLLGIHDDHEEDTPASADAAEKRSFASVLLGTASEAEQPEERPSPDAGETGENSQG